MFKLILFLTVFLNAYFVKAESIAKSIYFNAGTHTEFVNNVQTDTQGSKRKIDFAPTLGMGALIPIPLTLNLLPEINWVLPNIFKSEHIIKNRFMLRADIAYDPISWLRLRVGASIMHLNQQGRGGKARISNGTTSSTFYYPDENRSSLNTTFDMGVEGLINKNWAVRLQTYTYSLLRKESRQLSYTLFVSYYLD